MLFYLNSVEHDANAKIRATLERPGKPIDAYDVLIAATALAFDLVPVTSNEKEFDRVLGLVLENRRTE